MSKFGALQLTTLALSLSLAACGGSDEKPKRPPAYSYQGVGRFSADTGVIRFGKDVPVPNFPSTFPQLSADERKGYCAIYAEPETNEEARNEILKALNGEWRRHDPNSTSVDQTNSLDGEGFTFNAGNLTATRSGSWLGGQTITAKHICISKPLKDVGQYSDYRIVELSANNNDGVAVLAINFEKPAYDHSYPTLYMTEFQYYRHGATDSLRSQLALFTSTFSQDESTLPVEVYPFRH